MDWMTLYNVACRKGFTRKEKIREHATTFCLCRSTTIGGANEEKNNGFIYPPLEGKAISLVEEKQSPI